MLCDMLRLAALFFLLAAVETTAGPPIACETAAEESARATLDFLNVVAGMKQPSGSEARPKRSSSRRFSPRQKKREALCCLRTAHAGILRTRIAIPTQSVWI